MIRGRKEVYMIDFIRGYIEYRGEDYVIISCNDIGYKIMTSHNTLAKLAANNEKVCLHTEMIVREDSMTLCGFCDEDEKEMFKLLTSVSGVGTKVGLGILSSIPYEKIYHILTQGDVVALTAANGVGKKTAQRIVLELKDKVQKYVKLPMDDFLNPPVDIIDDSLILDAKEALLSLGYSNSAISKFMSKLDLSQETVESVIKKALKEMKL